MTAETRSSHAARGQPLLVLLALLGGWVAMRAVLWQSPFPPVMGAHVVAGASQIPPLTITAGAPHTEMSSRPYPRGAAGREPIVPGPLEAPNAIPLPPPFRPPAVPRQEPAILPSGAFEAPAPERHVVGQQLLLLAAFSHMQLPPEIAAYFASRGPAVRPVPAQAENGRALGRSAAPPPGAHRWSGDAWLLLRRDSAGTLAAAQPSYGRSQAGAVLRYRLAPSSGHRPVAYARVTRALAGPGETEVAVGLAARPISGLPVTVAGEVRAYDGPVHRELRPTAFAVTELPPLTLPLGLRGEVYVQAGYVGGRYATAFADGQARIDGKVARLGRTSELRVGAAAWGGAQKHTSRLDIGPSATLGFRLGQTQSRLAVDYRWRVAGNAEPRSGPALTISAGF